MTAAAGRAMKAKGSSFEREVAKRRGRGAEDAYAVHRLADFAELVSAAATETGISI